MKRSYIAASCGACDKRGKTEGKKGVTPVVRKTERLPCKEQRRHRSTVDGKGPGDRSNADADSTRVACNRLHGIHPICCNVVMKERTREREKETTKHSS